MPRARSGRAGTRKAARSKKGPAPKVYVAKPASTNMAGDPIPSGRLKKTKWDTMKVFDKPVFRLPYRLAMYTNGPKGAAYCPPDLWLQAGIEAGLVVMEPPKEGVPKGGWLEVIDKEAFVPLKPGELQELVNEGIRNNLRALENIDFDVPPGPQDWEAKAREREAAGDQEDCKDKTEVTPMGDKS